MPDTLILDHGRIVEIGSHDDLVGASGHCRRLSMIGKAIAANGTAASGARSSASDLIAASVASDLPGVSRATWTAP
ncbi:hypothetical protein EN784_24015 [bacterium M00.F.Ca.ET.141.01.1.1]|nr:hypothetical protein EN784_24015 [bacterium M00.F.Ca.ET.141.01.1.1]